MLINHKHEGWIVTCDECDDGVQHFHTSQTYLGGSRSCDECGGRGYREATEQEIDERDIPPMTAEQKAHLANFHNAALDAALARINAAFGVRS